MSVLPPFVVSLPVMLALYGLLPVLALILPQPVPPRSGRIALAQAEGPSFVANVASSASPSVALLASGDSIIGSACAVAGDDGKTYLLASCSVVAGDDAGVFALLDRDDERHAIEASALLPRSTWRC